MVTPLQFPSENEIIDYLKRHPSTDDSYLLEKNIIQTVAKIFANEKEEPENVAVVLAFTLQFLNKDLELAKAAIDINKNLIRALTDCANNKEISKN